MTGVSDSSFVRRRVLIAEDSSITQDLLKLLLTQRGHEINIVGDGEAAVKSLSQWDCDIALLDFHLPKLDGVEVAKKFLARHGHKPRPRLVAMTADIEGLLRDENNCEIFDEIIPKPLDINAVKNLIESEPVLSKTADAARGKSKAVPPQLKKPDLPESLASIGHKCLRWPDDFSNEKLAKRNLIEEVKEDRVGAIVIVAPVEDAFFSYLWRLNPLHLLPVFDACGGGRGRADIDATKLSASDAAVISNMIDSFRENREALHPDFWRSEDIGEKLLARIAVKGGTAKPVVAPRERSFVLFDVPLDEEIFNREMNKARAGGFVSGEFFDRLHACPNCRSSRLNIREECIQCGGANLSEEAYLHHFTCAYQGREQDFQHRDGLKCPKCSKHLSHFSIDYDKPGFVTCCASCGHSASETNVAFVCMDCGIRTGGDAMPTRDVYAYSLTDQGRAFLDVGRVYLGHAHQRLPLADLPLDLVIALNMQARRYNEDKTPFVLLNVGYLNARTVEREHGARQFSNVRNLFLENFGNALDDKALIVKGHFHDFALMKETDRSEIESDLIRLCEQASSTLRYDLGVSITAFGPQDFQ